VQELRTALVLVPQLLADLMRHVVAARAEKVGVILSIIAEIDDCAQINERLSMLAPDLIIFGPSAGIARDSIILPPGTRMLTLTHDLSRVLGPREGESAPLTPDFLAQCLRDIAWRI